MYYSVFKRFCQVFLVLFPIAIVSESKHNPQGQRYVNVSVLNRIKGSDGLRDFVKIILAEHNKFRKMHGCPPLTWNKNIAEYAQEWAEENANTNKLHHRPGPKYGENVFMISIRLSNPEKAVRAWYSEIKKFNFSNPKITMGSGHFTQVIWKASKELGCGIAVNKKSATYISCNYYPLGNMIGAARSNVPALIN